MGMKCNNCDGSGWQTYEKTYVETLPKRQQKEVNAVIVGASDGIDHDLIIQMRNGATAASLEKSSNANLVRWHHQLQDDYEHRCKQAKSRGINVRDNTFPPIDPSFSAKSQVLMIYRWSTKC